MSSKVLSDLISLLQRIPSEVYPEPLTVLSGSSIGQHVRHIIEFYSCLSSSQTTENVDYDKRQRNKTLENDPQKALEEVYYLLKQLEKINLDADLTLTTVFDGQEICVKTNYKRELIYLAEHSMHHFALIKIGLRVSEVSIEMSSDFGIAQSTIQYKQNVLTDLHTNS